MKRRDEYNESEAHKQVSEREAQMMRDAAETQVIERTFDGTTTAERIIERRHELRQRLENVARLSAAIEKTIKHSYDAALYSRTRLHADLAAEVDQIRITIWLLNELEIEAAPLKLSGNINWEARNNQPE